MCFLCQQNMSDETVKQQILKSIENPRFEVWNSTSISHIFLCLSGFNGYEVAELAYHLLKNYIAWAKEAGMDFDEYKDSIDYIASGLAIAKSDGVTNEDLKARVRASLH